MKYDNMSQKFCRGFATYMVKYENDKTRVIFPQGKKTASNKTEMIRKVARTTTSNKYVSQIRSIN